MFVAAHLTGFNAVARSTITYVGGKVFENGNGTTSVVLTDLTGGIAAAPAANDVVVVTTSISTGGSGDLDMTCSGYTEVADLFADDSSNANLGVFLKTMTATPDTSITLNNPPLGTSLVGAIQVWRNVDPTTPQDVAATTATGIDTVLANPPSITPVNLGALVIAAGAGGHAAGDADYGSPDLSGFLTEGSANNSTIGMGWSGPWTGGAVNPAAFTFGSADGPSYSWAACSLALRPL